MNSTIFGIFFFFFLKILVSFLLGNGACTVLEDPRKWSRWVKEEVAFLNVHTTGKKGGGVGTHRCGH